MNKDSCVFIVLFIVVIVVPVPLLLSPQLLLLVDWWCQVKFSYLWLIDCFGYRFLQWQCRHFLSKMSISCSWIPWNSSPWYEICLLLLHYYQLLFYTSVRAILELCILAVQRLSLLCTVWFIFIQCSLVVEHVEIRSIYCFLCHAFVSAFFVRYMKYTLYSGIYFLLFSSEFFSMCTW